VRFDRVILLNQDGTGTVPGVGALPAGAVTIAGNSISAVISGSMLASTGFAKLDYTWNLWPRDGEYTGFAQIADFAPNNANFTTTPVPEPGALAMMLAGLGVVVTVLRRRRG
jgi:PEP-CTERM motif